jgi:23S rRNA pseudouridine955/2504/2580 synthase
MVGKWARTGQIRIDGKRARPDERLAAGQVLRVPPGGDAAPRKREARPLTDEQLAAAEAMLIARTEAALVLNKPPGLATQGGTKTTSHVDGLLDAYAAEDEPRPRLVHRLDKDTSGVLLVARTPGSAAFFSRRFSGRSAKKVYWALVVGVPDIHEGLIEAPLAKQPGTGGEKMHVDMEGGQLAKTRYRVIDRAGNSAAWLELEPLTGRTHQLRVHCAAIGHPIVGDGKYGGQASFLTGSISRKMHLHARRLIIEQPKGGKLDVTAELPEHFAASMAQLGFDPALSDAAPEAPPPERSRAEKKQAARQHAKQVRKGRRGERTSRRTGGGKPKKPTKAR